MVTKNKVILELLALNLAIFIVFLGSVGGAKEIEAGSKDSASGPAAAISDLIISSPRVIPPGFYQFSNLEITKELASDNLPIKIEAVQKLETPCVILEGGRLENPLPCPTSKDKKIATYIIQIDEKTSLVNIDRDAAILADFERGDKINVLGLVSSDFTFIRAAVVRNLEKKNYHKSFSGTVKEFTDSGFILETETGLEILVRNPLAKGQKVTIQGVFDKASNVIDDVLSIIFKPFRASQIREELPSQVPETPLPVSPPGLTTEPSPAKAPPAKLFKNFLKVFGF